MGSIERTPAGTWKARYRDPQGRSGRKTFKRKRDAEMFLASADVDMLRGEWVNPNAGRMLFSDWVEEWRTTTVHLRASTADRYERDLRLHVLPRFGTMRLSDITPRDVRAAYRIGRLPADEIENWLNDEVAAGIAPSSVHRHYRLLRRMLQAAVQKQKLQANPCDRVEPPRVPKTEMTFLTWAQAVDLAEAHQERYRALIYLAVDSGMRWSELIGLRRARVDLGRHKVRVTEQMARALPPEAGWPRGTTERRGAGLR